MCYKRLLDLSSSKGYRILRKCLKQNNVVRGKPTRVRFTEYHINVDNRRTQEQNEIQVGFFYSLFNAIFRCEVRFLDPFRECCGRKVFPSNSFTITWSKLCKIFAKILLIFLLPTPFYLRLVIFYVFEIDELDRRKRAVKAGGLKESLGSSLMHYLTPTHGVFICMYILYIATAVVLAFMSQKGRDLRIKNVIVNSFRELKSQNFTATLSMIASNVVWPLKNFGALGFCVGIVYWPVAIVGSLLVGAVYLLPTLYLTLRMAIHSKLAAVNMIRQSKSSKYRVHSERDVSVRRYTTEELLRCKGKNLWKDSETDISLGSLDMRSPVPTKSMSSPKNVSLPRITKYTLCALLSILTMYAVVIILSEVIVCLVDVVVFTVMGCIVNASDFLVQYVMLIIMFVVYCNGSFNDVQVKYLWINRVLFKEIKYRIKDLDKVTRHPVFLRENHAFKLFSLGDYEATDDFADKPANHWVINNLCMFIDSNSTLRIPIQLFNEVMQIRVTGVPGPVYRGHIEALKHLSKIIIFVLFVFILVMSFGSIHKISTTNQTMATVVVGFLPRILKTFRPPQQPEMEVETVGFQALIDEILNNFCQYWPIYDLPFEVATDKDDDSFVDIIDDTVEVQKTKTLTEESKLDEAEENRHLLNTDMVHDDKDGASELPLSSQLIQMHETLDEEDVDIAIILPKWPEDDDIKDIV